MNRLDRTGTQLVDDLALWRQLHDAQLLLAQLSDCDLQALVLCTPPRARWSRILSALLEGELRRRRNVRVTSRSAGKPQEEAA